jgi:hypothetical protein
MRWAEHVARMGDEEKYIRSFGGKIWGKEIIGVDGSVMLKWILNMFNGVT